MNLKKEMLALTPKLRAHAWVLSRGAPNADDLVQETLLRAWQSRDDFAAGGNLKAWLFRILRTVHLASQAGVLNTVQDANAGAAQETDPAWRARFGALVDALADLPEQDCEALLLVTGSGLSYEEAAEVCYCPVAAIKARVSRARERLSEAASAPPSPSPRPVRTPTGARLAG